MLGMPFYANRYANPNPSEAGVNNTKMLECDSIRPD